MAIMNTGMLVKLNVAQNLNRNKYANDVLHLIYVRIIYLNKGFIN